MKVFRFTPILAFSLAVFGTIASSACKPNVKGKSTETHAIKIKEAGLEVTTALQHPNLTAALTSQIPAFRFKIAQMIESHAAFNTLRRPDAKEELSRILSSKIGNSVVRKELNAAYDRAAKKLDSSFIIEVFSIKRVYCYDKDALLQELRNGSATKPYITYDRERNVANINWTTDIAKQANEPLDMPLLLAVPGPQKDYIDYLNNELKTIWEPLMTDVFVRLNKIQYYGFISSFAEQSLPKIGVDSYWFAIGSKHFLAIQVFSDIEGADLARTRFGLAVPMPSSLDANAPISLNEWRPENTAINEPAYTHRAVDVLFQITQQTGNSRWFKNVLSRIASTDPSSINLSQLVQEEAGVDLSQFGLSAEKQ